MTYDDAAEAPQGDAGEDDGSPWVQIAEETRLRASIPPPPDYPVWEGTWLRRRLWLNRAVAVLFVAAVTIWLGWAFINGLQHTLASSTKTDGIVTIRTETGRHSDGCQLDVDYSVGAQTLHAVARVNAACQTLPGPASRVAIDVNRSDSHDIWIDGAPDANHPDPVIFGFLLLLGPSATILALWPALTGYPRIKKLVASGAGWRQFEATVSRKAGGRGGSTITLEAEDLSGNTCPFFIYYPLVSPIGYVRKGDKVTLTVLADGMGPVLLWRPEVDRITVGHIGKPQPQLGLR